MDSSSDLPGRSRRTRHDKKGRIAALEKLKQLKGTKHKYEVVDEAPVFEEVSEKEFSRLVQDRQEDDWIIDDNGSGYIEDGREIFEDDIEEDIYTDKKTKLPPTKRNVAPPKKNISKSSDIKNMFKTVSVKRKSEAEVKLDSDDILESIMEDMHNDTSKVPYTPKPMMLRKKHKLNHLSPSQRSQLNPFASKSSEAKNGSNFLPKEIESLKRNVAALHRRPLQPKVVDFDSNMYDASKEETIEEFHTQQFKKSTGNDKFHEAKISDSQLSEIPETQNIDEIPETEDLEFENLNSDFFTDVENSAIPKNENDQMPSPESLTSNFQGTFDIGNTNVAIPDIHVDTGHLPLTTTLDGKTVFRFFWFDAFEDQYKHPGIVYLFGKVFCKEVNAYCSCCVIVKDIPRCVYILPRETKYDMQAKQDTEEPITMSDVYSEVGKILEKIKVTEFKAKKVVKSYAFEHAEIPNKCEYLEVHYSAHHPPIPANTCGSTFSNILGADSSSLELLLLNQKLKGPGWLDVQFPQLSTPPVSWCKFEVFVTKIQHIVPVQESLPVPPVVVACLNLITAVNSKTHQHEIAAISCFSHHEFPLDKSAPVPPYQSHFSVLTKPSDCIFPYDFKEAISTYKKTKVERIDSERGLLSYFLAKIHKLDPDIIIGNDIVGFDLNILLHRIIVHKIPNWSRIGRLKRTGQPRLSNSSYGGAVEKNAACGRLLCDIKISSKELLRCRSYDLPELSSHILNRKYVEVSPDCVPPLYASSQLLLQLVDHGMMTAELVLQIACEINILPLALQITNIAGCIMSRTLLGGRSERNEYLLLHAFHEKNFICPPKSQGKKPPANLNAELDDLEVTTKQGRRKPAYEGGLVLEPKKGFYDKYILLMDFNSLYPSIIQEYNICFTTIPRNSESPEKEEVQVNLPEQGLDPGVLPTEIRKLVESRKQVKQMMKASDISKERYAQFDIRQSALKLTANSMYGCLGFTHSRFYAKPLAALITYKGREILLQTKELVEKMGLDVIYGDTDSIMINTNQVELDDVTQLGSKVKSEINKLYRLLEIDIDGVYKPMLLLKKKKYAALSITRLANGQIVSKEEIKGLDIVRRDWSQLAKQAGQFVVKEILSAKSKDDIVENIHSHLITLGEEVNQGKKPISNYIVYKQLTKNPEDYPNKKNLCHVVVALRMNEKGGKKLRANDTVPYIICTDGTNLPPIQRAYHPEELKTNDKLKIDTIYYLSQQIHPVVTRLCAPIEGTDAAVIARFLGLDSSKYASVIRQDEEEADTFLNPSSLFDDADRFKDCDKFVIKCPGEKCSQEITVDQPFNVQPESVTCQLIMCPNSNCRLKLSTWIPSIINQLQKSVRRYISKYYQRVLVCEDVGCAYQTRKMPLIITTGGPVCPSCQKSNMHLEYNEAHLYTQLAYFQYLFDLEKAKTTLTSEQGNICVVDKESAALYRGLKAAAEKVLHSSAYGIVDLGILFQGLFDPE